MTDEGRQKKVGRNIEREKKMKKDKRGEYTRKDRREDKKAKKTTQN